jgi:acetolactate synthase-1/2/3 large subunit
MICHGVVGLQHATMAMYNAWCDRVPVYVMGGTIIEANKRGTTPEWVHAAVDIAAGVRDYTKWDDQPISLQHSPSRRCAYKIATTPPMGPVMLSLDAELQGRQKLESLRRRNVPETVTLAAQLHHPGNGALLSRLFNKIDALGLPFNVGDRRRHHRNSAQNVARTPA